MENLNLTSEEKKIYDARYNEVRQQLENMTKEEKIKYLKEKVK